MKGELGFPVALRWNSSRLPSWARWTLPAAAPDDWSNAPTLTSWHNQVRASCGRAPPLPARGAAQSLSLATVSSPRSPLASQGWYQGTYAVTGIDHQTATLNMSSDGQWPSGGWQGGRTMECVNPDDLSTPLGSGPFYVSGVFEELDEAGEYFWDPAARKLYVYYNASAGTPPPADWALVASQLEVFFNASGSPAAPVADLSWAGLGFRDQRHGLLERWVDPSGGACRVRRAGAAALRPFLVLPPPPSRALAAGDWGLRRAGALHLEGTERATVSGCTFFRTDANAVFLAAYNRNATVTDNEFAFIGMSAVVTFGATQQDDGTVGTQPWGTVIAYNLVRELGTYQLQSSAWFTSRAALTRAEGNVVFNIPRAAINFNDAFGGGNNVSHVSIFNTCRQSGDHGPMNSCVRVALRFSSLAPPRAPRRY